jgi:hypothetical protein
VTVSIPDTLPELERVIGDGLRSFVGVGLALARIRDGALYQAEHKTFEGYCAARWNMQRAQAYRLIEAASVVENVSHGRLIEPPTNERQARELARLPAGQQAPAWEEAVRTAPEGKVTAKHVRDVVAGYLPPKPSSTRRKALLVPVLLATNNATDPPPGPAGKNGPWLPDEDDLVHMLSEDAPQLSFVDLRIHAQRLRIEIENTIKTARERARRTVTFGDETLSVKEVREACLTLNIDVPKRNTDYTKWLAAAKRRSRDFLRMYHPDSNGGSDRTVELYRGVMDAYLVCEQHADLYLAATPERVRKAG